MNIRFRHFAMAAMAVLAIVFTAPAAAAIRMYGGTYEPEGGSGRTGSGTLYMEYDEASDVLSISTTFTGLSGNTTVAHIHCCTAAPYAGNAGVALDSRFGLPLFSVPVGVKGGAFERAFVMDFTSFYNAAFLAANGSTRSARDRLLAAFSTGNAYFNIHTSTFGGGEIRAWIAPVPEPGTWTLMALGPLAVAAASRRRPLRRVGARQPAFCKAARIGASGGQPEPRSVQLLSRHRRVTPSGNHPSPTPSPP
jgi:hypothetical protein